jgi:hypothetical protein
MYTYIVYVYLEGENEQSDRMIRRPTEVCWVLNIRSHEYRRFASSTGLFRRSGSRLSSPSKTLSKVRGFKLSDQKKIQRKVVTPKGQYENGNYKYVK